MKDIYTFKFWKHKYGPELLVDIVDYAVMLPPIRRHTIFTETFYSVTIVLDADETLSVDGAPSHIEHGSVVTSIPGEVWQFSTESQLKGFNLAFEKEFLLTFSCISFSSEATWRPCIFRRSTMTFSTSWPDSCAHG